MRQRAQRGPKRTPGARPVPAGGTGRGGTPWGLRPPPGWVWLAIALGAGGLAFFRSLDTDFWFHLAAGRSILQHGFPSSEVWCLAGRGGPPELSEWLFDVALYGVRAVGGDFAIALWRAAWEIAAVALAIRLVRLLDADTWIAALIVPLAVVAGRERMVARPEQLSVALALLYFAVFEGARRARRDRTLWLLPVQVVWANAHPSWFYGPGIAWLYAASAWWEGARGGARPAGKPAATPADLPARRARRWILLGLALLAVSAAVPTPRQSLVQPIRFLLVSGGDPIARGVDELQPWTWPRDLADPYTGFSVLVLLALAMGARRAIRASLPLSLAAVGITVLSFAAIRFRGMAALVALAPVAVGLSVPGIRGRLALAASACAGIAAAVWIGVQSHRAYAIGVAPAWRTVPVRAAAVADSLHLEGPVLNTVEYGGYLLWARGDAHPPLLDARAGSGSNAFRSLYVRAIYDSAAHDSLIRDWGITWAVLRPPSLQGDQMAVALARRPGWSLVFADDAGLLFARRDILPASDRWRIYRWVTPDYDRMIELAARAGSDSALKAGYESELRRASTEVPGGWGTADRALVLLKLNCGEFREALRLIDEYERIRPDLGGFELLRGAALQGLHDLAGARAAYERALREPASAGVARQALDRLP